MATDSASLSPRAVYAILPADGRLLFLTRLLRLFGYGFLSVILVLYLVEVGLTTTQVGLLLTFTLLGDTAISLWLTTQADRLGRRRTLLAGAALMVIAGIVFAFTSNYILLIVAATIGVISPSGNEVGPFLSVEQASLTQLFPAARRTQVFAWYNLVGSFTTALGALLAGSLAQLLQNHGWSALDSYRVVVLGYAAVGALLFILFLRVSPNVEASLAELARESNTLSARFGLHGSQKTIMRLSGLFALDAFGGGFVVQTIVAYWFTVKFGVDPGLLGAIFFGANVLAGVSSLLAVRLAARFGLINTMVFTHIPSNILLMLVPLMPTLTLAIVVLLLRFSISQMDVPTRQSYVMAVVQPEERSAASGITGVARTIGAGISPVLVGPLLAIPALLSTPFFIAGTLKIVYDLLLYRDFKAVRPPEEVQ
ncbi:MAG: MFS transporter [Anaerolineae bacterium]